MRKTFLIWLAGGILLVNLAFFIPEQTGSLWPSIILSGSAAVLYLIVFAWFWVGEVNSSSRRQLIGWTIAVLLGFSLVSAGISYQSTDRQFQILDEIRFTIEKGISEVHIKEALLKTLRDYQNLKEENSMRSLGGLFYNNYDSLLTEEGRFLYDGTTRRGEKYDKNLKIFLAHSSADSVVLVAESFHIEGRDSTYGNLSGAVGKFQTRGVLTDNGVRYERIN